MDKLIELVDIASANETAGRDNSIRACQDKLKPAQVKDQNGEWETTECDSCGEPIGEKRLEATGSKLCIHCATKAENKRIRK